jgi:protein-disulfide isomerase
MRRFLLAACLAAASSSALAQSAGFTPEQRAEIVRIVRDALKADPSILREAVTALQADDAAKDAADAKARIAANHDKLYARQGDAVAGNPSGDVSLVEFYDPRCPYCKRMLPALDALLHSDRGVRLIYKEIPVLGPASVTESRAILAAQNQGGYFKMQSALMSSAAEPTDAMIRDAATSAGLDPAKILADMKSPAVSKRLQDNLTLAHELKVEGTPAFVVGNQIVPGAVGEEGLASVIASFRKKS